MSAKDLAKGLYEGVIEGHAFATSEKGKDFVEIRIKLDKKVPTEGQAEPLPNATFCNVRMFFTEATIEKFNVFERLQVCGLKGKDLTKMRLAGNRVKVFKGDRDDYDFVIYLPGGGGNFKPRESDPDVARKLNSLFADKLKEVGSNATHSSASPTPNVSQGQAVDEQAMQTATQEPEDPDDIPF